MNEFLNIVLTLIASLLGGYLGVYFKKKGENLTTKDDLWNGSITQRNKLK